MFILKIFYIVTLFTQSFALFCPNGFPIYNSGSTPDDINVIVDWHNFYRYQIAIGNVTGQPKASNMKRMAWDSILSSEADNIANTCTFAHVNVDDVRFLVGQNLYTSWHTEDNSAPDWGAAITAWYDEVQQYTFGTDIYDHYTQVVWANTNLVGCSYTMFQTTGLFPYQKLYVCNYGPAGNMMGEAPYEIGDGCENLC